MDGKNTGIQFIQTDPVLWFPGRHYSSDPTALGVAGDKGWLILRGLAALSTRCRDALCSDGVDCLILRARSAKPTAKPACRYRCQMHL